jgi:class 3 adenylate cyclase/tetratricopeptide (TPR) repeat protein
MRRGVEGAPDAWPVRRIMTMQRVLQEAGERKPVTAVFADVVDSTRLAESLDPEDWAEIAAGLYAAADAAVARYGGTVTQLSGDAVVALFGAPVAHEDDPERAVRAALALLDAVAEMAGRVRAEHEVDLRLRVGVNTGLAVVGRVGGPGHEEYTALGDAMNVAARMQTAARPGTVLVTRATHDRVADLVTSTRLGSLTVKGKQVPVEAFEVTAIADGSARARGVAGLTSPMVGRGAELDRLVGLLRLVEAGRGRLALVLGEPGIGKSRLLAELRERRAGARWLEGRCLSYGRDLADHLVRDLVASMVDGELTPPAVDRLVASLLDDDADTVAGHLLHLVGLPVPAGVAAALTGLDPTAVRRRHLEALRAVLVAMAGAGPLVVVCEDLHWADAASVDLLADLADIVDHHPVLLVVTSRPDRDAEGWRLVTRVREALGDALTELRLEALSVEHSRALVANLLEIESLPGHVRRQLLARADGNPFFLEEVIRALVDVGVITRRGERWVASPRAVEVDVPETVHGLLLARVDRLPAPARRCLRVASVLGRTFSTDLLASVGDDGLDVLGELGVLEAHGLVRIEASAPELVFAFRHALVQEAAYAGLLRRERQALHRRVADLLVARDDAASAVLLAHHLDLAGEPDRALPYLLEAARQALARYANREALVWFRRAAEVVVDRSDPASCRTRIEAVLGEVEAGFTFVPALEQLALLEPLVGDAEALGDDRLLARVHLWIGWVRHSMGEWYARSQAMRTSIERARALGERLGDEELTALPLGVIGSAAYGAGRFREAVADLTTAVAVLERRERLADASVFASMAAMASGRLGAFGDADAWVLRAMRLAERSGDPNAVLDADLAAGAVATERGRLEEAVAHTTRAVERATEVGNVACALVGSFFLGDQHLRLGDAAAAIPPLERSSELADYCDAGSYAGLSQAWLATARARSGGDLATELADLDATLAVARDHEDALGEAEILHHRASLVAGTPAPDWAAVFADLDAAVAAFEQLGAVPALARTLEDYARALDVAGRHDESTQVRRRAAALVDGLATSTAGG